MSRGDEEETVDLAEWIVDEISQANQDWRAIELRARELVELLAQRAAVQAGVSERLGAERPAQEWAAQGDRRDLRQCSPAYQDPSRTPGARLTRAPLRPARPLAPARAPGPSAPPR
jgi:hypothetical protein